MAVFPEGDTALASDQERRSLIKINELIAGGAGGGGGGGTVYVTHQNGPPGGGTAGLVNIDDTNRDIYFKVAGNWIIGLRV